MDISVIIPVYNAERFLAEAIESVLIQPEVKEILLVEDGSKDHSLVICQTYADNNPHVRLIQHSNGVNKGAAESRNQGIQNAQCEYLAFLDADDLYLPNRFTETLKTFHAHPDADGVYETVGTMHEDHGLPTEILKRAGSEQARIEQTDPLSLYRTLAAAKNGYIHLNGFVIKHRAFDETLMFDPVFRQCQDTDFLLRWSAITKLYGTHPAREVAMRRVHDQNRVFNIDETLYYRHLCMRKCAINQFYGSKDREANWQIMNRMARASKLVSIVKRLHLPVTPFRLIVIGTFLLAHPMVVRHISLSGK